MIAVALLAVALFLYSRFVAPLTKIARDLEKMAAGQFTLPPLQMGHIPYRSILENIQTIAGLLRELDRQSAEEGLSLRSILSGMKEGILIVNRDRKITLVNDALQSLLAGAKPSLGRSMLEVFRRHELEQAVASAFSTGEKQQLEIALEFSKPNEPSFKKTFTIHIAPMPKKSGDPAQATLVVFQDVTDIRALEATRREFVANVSHEFRTPLTVINGFVETLIEGDADDPEMAAHSLSLIHRNVQRLSLLLEDLLTISSVESRGHALDFSSVNLRELFDGVLANLQAGIASGSVDFDIKWDEAAEFAEVDAKRIEQVYWNLLTNAIRHGEVDPLSIRIVAKRCESSIVLAFTDNGAGIPLEDQIHIFERFYRVHKHRARDKGGTGLGLSIVKNIIMAHGGSVSLQSTPGEGSTFFVTLPIHQKGILLRGKS